jgi:hypothetical protein
MANHLLLLVEITGFTVGKVPKKPVWTKKIRILYVNQGARIAQSV